MKKYGILCTSVLLGIMLLGGCSDSDSDSKSNTHIVSCNIASAKSLVVLPGGTMEARAASTSISPEILYMVDENGDLVPVTGTDDSGKEIEVPAPTKVIDISADWLILVYPYPYVNYLVNKEKGNTYILTEEPELLRANSGYLGLVRQSVFTDEAGNFYFLSGERCQKLNISDENKVTITAYTPDIYHISSVHEFCVDSAGNVLFSYNDEMMGEAMKIKTASESLKNPDSDRASGNYKYSFAGYDGALYCDGLKYTIVNNELVSAPYGLTESDFYSLGNRGAGSQGLIWFYFDDSIWVTDRSMNTYAELYNVDPTVRPSVYPISELSNERVKAVAQDASSIFIATNSGKIYKFDIESKVVSQVFDNSDYEFYAFAVTDNGLIQFSALNLSNLHKIFATVSIDSSEVTILGDNLEDEVKILQRIK